MVEIDGFISVVILNSICTQPLVTKQKNRSHFYEYSPSKSSESSELLEVVQTTEVSVGVDDLYFSRLLNNLHGRRIFQSSRRRIFQSSRRLTSKSSGKSSILVSR
ncbi:hypothetical protein YC2023_070145 [Brassica napus]